MPKTIVIFNGAPNTGKDTAAKLMQDFFTCGECVSFKEVLFEETAKYFDVDLQKFKDIHNDRELKELPVMFDYKHLFKFHNNFEYWYKNILSFFNILPESQLLSTRQALIFVSEEIIKPKYGKDYFGLKLLEHIEQSDEKYFFCSDGGFVEEITPFFNTDVKVVVVNLYRDGCHFTNDSRKLLSSKDFDLSEYSYPFPPYLQFTKMYNNGSEKDLEELISMLSVDIVLNNIQDIYTISKDDILHSFNLDMETIDLGDKHENFS